MKYINTLSGEVCPSLWVCVKTYFSDRKAYGIKSWAWVSLKEYNEYRGV